MAFSRRASGMFCTAPETERRYFFAASPKAGSSEALLSVSSLSEKTAHFPFCLA